ncbi:MAG: hypothetical protein LBI28_09445 [Treponema sp.]|jgi:uncharacterized membrane protein YgcG|nr:hypothetical protein [Treponema sp.]
MKKRDFVKFLGVIAVAVILVVGCSTGSTIVTGTVRPAIDPAEVKIYLEPPSQYEIIGMVETSSEVGFSTQAAQDRVIEELKKQAAKIGANGVLLLDTGSRSSGSNGGVFIGGGFPVGRGRGGFSVGGGGAPSNSEIKTARGQAIYVSDTGDTN